MKINLLLCDTFPGLLPADIPSYPYMFRKLFDAIEPDIRYRIFSIEDLCLPETFHKDELYVITGSTSSAYDKKPWIRSLITWIRMAHEQEINMVGICFGHQVIAQALGGKVAPATCGWGIGVRTADIIEQRALNYFPSGKMSLLCNHHDQVTELPPHAKSFASSEFCPNEGFTIGSHIVTFQAHPEYSVNYTRHLLEHHADQAPEELRRAAIASLEQEPQGSQAARWMLDMVR